MRIRPVSSMRSLGQNFSEGFDSNHDEHDGSEDQQGKMPCHVDDEQDMTRHVEEVSNTYEDKDSLTHFISQYPLDMARRAVGASLQAPKKIIIKG